MKRFARWITWLVLAFSVPAFAAGEAPAPAGAVKWTPVVKYGALFPVYVYSYANTKPLAVPVPGLLGDPNGVLGIVVTVPGPTRLRIGISLETLVEAHAEEFQIAAAGQYVLYPRLRYKYTELPKISQPMKATAVWTVDAGGGPQEKSEVVDIRSVNEAPIAWKNYPGNFAPVFAAYVNEDHPWIDTVLKAALQKGLVRAFTGYQSGDELQVHVQARAIYETLRQMGFSYSSITATSDSNREVYSQHVRFISEAIGNQQANCIDGTVMMASILRKIGIASLIVLGPGHAMLGYWADGPSPKGGKKLALVETTMLGSGDWVQSVRSAAATYAKWQPLAGTDPRVQIIDIAKAREYGISPIPR